VAEEVAASEMLKVAVADVVVVRVKLLSCEGEPVNDSVSVDVNVKLAEGDSDPVCLDRVFFVGETRDVAVRVGDMC
jgi:hypothetical protein